MNGKVVAGTVIAAAITAQVLLNRVSYRVERVVDGDTFVTTENQMVRLTGIDAPETENCMGPEAKKELEKLILNKKVYLKVVYKDKLFRLISHVYTDRGLVAAQMLRTGMAYYTQTGLANVELQMAARQARDKKLGVYSPRCNPVVNSDQPKCLIKANKREGSSTQLYRFPGCGQYANTLVQLSLGDRWFCTESEAKKAGFTKGSDCFNQTFSP